MEIAGWRFLYGIHVTKMRLQNVLASECTQRANYFCNILDILLITFLFWYFQMGAKYDPDAEREVRHWFQQVLGEDIGEGPNAVEKNLRNGVILVK